jgi:hypothetical protein
MRKKIHLTPPLKNANKKKEKSIVAFVEPTKTFPFLAVAISFIAIHAFLNFNPEIERGWGLNFVSLFPTPVIAGFYLIMIAVCIPSINRQITNLVAQLSKEKIVALARKYKYILFLTLAVGMGFLFYMAQVKYVLLGDVGIRPTDIERNYIVQNEFLSMWIFIKLYHLLQPILNLSAMQIIQYNSYLCGALFVYFAPAYRQPNRTFDPYKNRRLRYRYPLTRRPDAVLRILRDICHRPATATGIFLYSYTAY